MQGELPPHMQGKRYLITGRSGTGKTTLAMHIIDAYNFKGFNVIALISDSNQLKQVGPVLHVTLETDVNNINFAAIMRDKHSIRIAVETPEPEELLEAVSSLALDGDIGGTLLVFDDTHRYMNTRLSPNLSRVFAEGRSRGVHALVIGQRIGQVGNYGTSMTILNNTNAGIVFCTTEPNELKRLEAYFPGLGATIASLPVPGGYIWRDFDTGMAWSYDPRRGVYTATEVEYTTPKAVPKTIPVVPKTIPVVKG